jgi:hypothetical protein
MSLTGSSNRIQTIQIHYPDSVDDGYSMLLMKLSGGLYDTRLQESTQHHSPHTAVEQK